LYLHTNSGSFVSGVDGQICIGNPLPGKELNRICSIGRDYHFRIGINDPQGKCTTSTTTTSSSSGSRPGTLELRIDLLGSIFADSILREDFSLPLGPVDGPVQGGEEGVAGTTYIDLELDMC
jgi:hypothetical protein